MKTVVALTNAYDNEMQFFVFDNESKVEAMRRVLSELEFEPPEYLLTEEDYEEFAFNCDNIIGAIEIDL